MNPIHNPIIPTTDSGVRGALAHCDGSGIRFLATVTRVSGHAIAVDQPVHMLEVDERCRFRILFGAGWPVRAVEMCYSLGPPVALAEIAGERCPGVAWNATLSGQPFPLAVSQWLYLLAS